MTLFTERTSRPSAGLVAASDADPAGDRYAACLTELATAAGVRAARLRPPHGVGDWNELLVRPVQGQGTGTASHPEPARRSHGRRPAVAG